MPSVVPLRANDPSRLGVYTLRGRLGEGGQGVVYLAADESGYTVAVKWLRPEISGDPSAARRFAREVSAATRVAPFCTAQLLGTGVEQDRPFIVSEYIDGPSLEKVVKESGPRTGAALHRLAIGTATALAAIHQAGIVHRDFKPANVLMGHDGPRVIDFGVARAVGMSLTANSVLAGTPAYMAPEQIRGEPVLPATDLFAWAGTVVYAATGAPLFGDDSLPAVMYRVLNAEPDLSGLSGRLRDLVEACLDKDPARRPSAEQVVIGLLQGHSTAAPPTLGEAAAAASERLSPSPGPGWASPGVPPEDHATRPAAAPRMPSYKPVPAARPGDRRAGRRRLLIGTGAVLVTISMITAVALIVQSNQPGDDPTTTAARSPGTSPGSSLGSSPGEGSDSSPGSNLGSSLGSPPSIPTSGTTKRLKGASDFEIYENPADPIRLTSYTVQDPKSKKDVGYARGINGTFTKYPDYVSADTSPDGRYLARVGSEYTKDGYDWVEIVDLRSGAKTRVKTVKSPLTTVFQHWSRDSGRILLRVSRGSKDEGFAVVTIGDTRVRMVTTGVKIDAFGYRWANAAGEVLVVKVKSGDGWNLRFYSGQGTRQREFNDVGEPAVDDPFSPSGRSFVTKCPDAQDGLLCVWDTRTGARIRQISSHCSPSLGWYDENHLYCWSNKADAAGRDVVEVIDFTGKAVRTLLAVPSDARLSPTFSVKPEYVS